LGVQVFREELERVKAKLYAADENVGRTRADIRQKGLPVVFATADRRGGVVYADADCTVGDEDAELED
jgi:hypothetical protein